VVGLKLSGKAILPDSKDSQSKKAIEAIHTL
jgi:hypothetical protein